MEGVEPREKATFLVHNPLHAPLHTSLHTLLNTSLPTSLHACLNILQSTECVKCHQGMCNVSVSLPCVWCGIVGYVKQVARLHAYIITT